MTSHARLVGATIIVSFAVFGCARHAPMRIAGSLACAAEGVEPDSFRVQLKVDSAALVLQTRFSVRVRSGEARRLVIQSANGAQVTVGGTSIGAACDVTGGGMVNVRTLDVQSASPVVITVVNASDNRVLQSLTLQPQAPRQDLAWGHIRMGFSGGVGGL